MKVGVINCSNPIKTERESDIYVDYRGGKDSCFLADSMIRKCVSWHSISAAYESEFFVYNKLGWQGIYGYDRVLVLIKEDLREVFPLVKKLKMMRKTVLIGFHENTEYLLNLFQDLNYFNDFVNLCNSADYYWNLNHNMRMFLDSVLKVPIFDGLHAAPFEWSQRFKTEEKSGVTITTRTFNQFLSRNTLCAIGTYLSYRRNACDKITVVQEDGGPNVQAFLRETFHSDRIVVLKSSSLFYEDWLKLLARHSFGFQLDCSNTYGQVVLDGQLVGTNVYGGNSLVSQALGFDFDLNNISKLGYMLYDPPKDMSKRLLQFTYTSIKDNLDHFINFNNLFKHTQSTVEGLMSKNV